MTKQNPYQLKEVKKLIAPNGRPIVIWSDGDKQYVQLVQIYSALGFNGTFGLDTTLGVIFKNKRFSMLTKQVANNRTSYVTNLDAIIPILESFIRLTLMTTPRAKHNQPIRDNARMEAERLIEFFNREVFNKPGTVTTTKDSMITAIRSDLNQTVSSIEVDTQMENNTGTTTVPVITVKDFDDIGERAEAIVRIFGSSKKDALRTAVTLKAEEINRDLTPLHELLA